MIMLLILASVNESLCIFEEVRYLKTFSIFINARTDTFKPINETEKMEVILNKNPVWILNPRLNSSRSIVSHNRTVNSLKIPRSSFQHSKNNLFPTVAMTHVPLKPNIQQ